MEILKPEDDIKPILDLDETFDLLKRIYDIDADGASIVQLPGYDDLNFKVTIDGKRFDKEMDSNNTERTYVFKVMNSLDSQDLRMVTTTNDLLLFLDSKRFKVPVPIATVDGAYYKRLSLRRAGDKLHVVRLMRYLKGKTLIEAYGEDQETARNGPKWLKFFHAFGRTLAELDNALKTFPHAKPFAARRTIWMLSNLPQLKQFLYAVEKDDEEEAVLREAIERGIGEFERRVLPQQNAFESGLIHGDFNEQNILIDVRNDRIEIVGLLDFGDVNVNCYLYELAIAIAYALVVTLDLDVGGHVAAGYRSVKDIDEEQFGLLKVCVVARLCQTLVMSAHSIRKDPTNDYLLSTAKNGRRAIIMLMHVEESVLLNRWRAISREYR